MSLLALVPILGKVLENVIPDPKAAAEAKFKVLELADKAEGRELDAEVQTMLAQLRVNEAEAKSGSLYIAGWRPAIGWTCAISLFCYYVPYCLIATVIWAMQCIEKSELVARPDLGIADLFGLVFAMLGIAGMRSHDKTKGIATRFVEAVKK